MLPIHQNSPIIRSSLNLTRLPSIRLLLLPNDRPRLRLLHRSSRLPSQRFLWLHSRLPPRLKAHHSSQRRLSYRNSSRILFSDSKISSGLSSKLRFGQHYKPNAFSGRHPNFPDSSSPIHRLERRTR